MHIAWRRQMRQRGQWRQWLITVEAREGGGEGEIDPIVFDKEPCYIRPAQTATYRKPCITTPRLELIANKAR